MQDITETSNEIYQYLRSIIQSLSIHSKFLSKRFGLTGPQLIVLKTIYTQDYSTIGSLAKAISLSQATVTTILDRLESRGLVIRTRSHIDKRRVHVSITEAAQTILSQNPTVFPIKFIEEFQHLSDEKTDMVLFSLKTTADMLRNDCIEENSMTGEIETPI